MNPDLLLELTGEHHVSARKLKAGELAHDEDKNAFDELRQQVAQEMPTFLNLVSLAGEQQKNPAELFVSTLAELMKSEPTSSVGELLVAYHQNYKNFILSLAEGIEKQNLDVVKMTSGEVLMMIPTILGLLKQLPDNPDLPGSGDLITMRIRLESALQHRELSSNAIEANKNEHKKLVAELRAAYDAQVNDLSNSEWFVSRDRFFQKLAIYLEQNEDYIDENSDIIVDKAAFFQPRINIVNEKYQDCLTALSNIQPSIAEEGKYTFQKLKNAVTKLNAFGKILIDQRDHYTS